MAHTPAPWRVEEGTTLIWGNCDPDDKSSYGMGYPVVDCEYPRLWRREHPTDDEIEGNAVLVAAAPELLAALRLILPMAREYAAQHPVETNTDCIHIAEEIIYRAEPPNGPDD